MILSDYIYIYEIMALDATFLQRSCGNCGYLSIISQKRDLLKNMLITP